MTAATHIGKVRATNEDCVRILPALHLAVVADGMGGHAAGEVASGMAVDALCDFYRAQRAAQTPGYSPEHPPAPGNPLVAAFRHANREVHDASHRLRGCRGMGTTLLAAAFGDGRVHVGHIGDCRLYRFTGQNLKPLTTDHTLAAALRAADPNARPPARTRHVLQKALGLEARCRPDFFTAATAAGEAYLLCSDGLCGVVNDGDLTAILSQQCSRPEACVEALVAACLERGAPDNISVIVVRVRGRVKT